MPGPRPKPTHLKLIRGNPGRRKLNQNEPKPVGDLSEPPKHFDAELKEVWDYALEHAPAGLLKKIDGSILEAWCTAHMLHRRALGKLRETGMVFKTPNTEVPMQSPYLAIVNKQALIMMRAIDHLGFSPASRTRISLGDVPTTGFGGWDAISG